MKPEIFFFRYAFPCSFVLLLRKEITRKDYELVYKSAKEEKLYLSIKKIEKIFWRPLEFVGSISDLNSVQNYWWFDHNKHLESGKIKNLDKKLLKDCMIIPCEVLSVKKHIAVVKSEFYDKDIKLKIDFVKVKAGDKVTKHYDYISEKISESLNLKMIERLKKITF